MNEQISTMETKMDSYPLAVALAKAQGEMKNATLNKINPHFKSKFADLAAVRDATIPALARNGLSIVQFTRITADRLSLVTRLMHESGESIDGEFPLPPFNTPPQAMGSALTYAKRYCWSAMCGIAADEDDDANEAQDNSATQASEHGAKLNEGAFSTQPKDSRDPNWTGPLTKTALAEKCREIVREIMGCSDADQLDAYLGTVKTAIDQLAADLPRWWDNDDEEKIGVMQRIARIRKGFDASPQADWKTVANDIKKGIDACVSLGNLNAYMESEDINLAMIQAQSKTAYEFLTKRADARRSVFAQAPNGKAA